MMPRVLVRVVACILAWASVALAQPQPLPEPLSDPQFLRNLSWKADKDLEAVVRNWPAYTKEQPFEDKTVLKEAEVTILSVPFYADYRVFKTDSAGEIVVRTTEYGKDFCSRFVAWATWHLGGPSKVIDLSRQELGYENLTSDWLLGQGRVRLSCVGSIVYGKYLPVIAILLYGHKDRLKALEDLIYVECSATRQYVGDLAREGQPPEERPPFALVIDPNNKRLLKTDKSSFLETTRYTDEKILASQEGEEVKLDFRLDRVTGIYQWNGRLKSDSRSGSDQWGKCSRVDPARKF